MWWLNFILDEAQSYAWKGSREDVDVFATRGRRYGIRSWFLTQRPQNISSTIINNAQNQIIFRTGPYETPYFKSYRIPIEEEQEWLKKKYHYILYDGFRVYRCYPIK
jgi:DNA helicase HerA-like ATPase